MYVSMYVSMYVCIYLVHRQKVIDVSGNHFSSDFHFLQISPNIDQNAKGGILRDHVESDEAND